MLYPRGSISDTAREPDRVRHHEERRRVGNPTTLQGWEDVSLAAIYVLQQHFVLDVNFAPTDLNNHRVEANISV